MTKHSGLSIFWLISSGVGLIGILLLLLFPEISLAATSFQPLVGIPRVTENPEVTENFGLYINALYILAITIGAMLAVLKLIAAGVKYMFSDIVTTKAEAKNDIKGALLGLLIVIGAVVILNTINTNLTDVKLNIPSPVVDVRNLLKERLREALNECTEENQCVVEECRGWLMSILVPSLYSCAEACKLVGGKYADLGLLDRYIHEGTNRDKCLRPFNDKEKCKADEHIWVDAPWPWSDYCQNNKDTNRKTKLIECDEKYFILDFPGKKYSINCTEAIQTCTDKGGYSLSPNPPHLPYDSISCSLPPGVPVKYDIIRCEPITSTPDPEDFDCTAAEAACTSAPNNGSIVDDIYLHTVKCLKPEP